MAEISSSELKETDRMAIWGMRRGGELIEQRVWLDTFEP
jgi:hypothetical protein